MGEHLPSVPSPPESPPPGAAPEPTRRSMLLWLAGGAGVAAAGAVGVPLVGYLAGVLGSRPVVWVPVGPVAQFPGNETRLVTFENPYRLSWDGASGKSGAYVRSLGADASGEHQFLVFAMNCTHLGCAVTWFPQSELFMCPCHGGVYYANGDRASGPPPRGLYKMPWRVTNGVLEVQAPHLPTLQDTLDKPSDLVQLGFIRRNRGA
jgi:menaquinol-cytochrome c reductase iron-sulfur subunit